MTPFLADHPGNPSGAHGGARAAKTALEEARETVAAISGCRPRRGRVHRRRQRGRQPRGQGRGVGPRASATARSTESSRPGSSTRRCSARATGSAARAFGSTRVGRDARRRRRPRRAGRRARRAHRGRLGDARQQRDRRRVSRSTRSRDSCASARRTPSLHTDAVQAPQWLDFGRDSPRMSSLITISGHKFGGPKGVGALDRARRHRARPAHRGRRSRSAGCGPGTQNVAGIVAFATALRVTHEQRARGDGAHRDACATTSSAGSRREVAGFSVNGATASARRRAPALHVRRRRGRDAARRARPAGRHGRVGLGVQLRRGRSVARAARDGHVPRARAVVGPVLARLRVDARRRRHRTRDRARSRRQAAGRRDGARHGDDERRRRLVGRGRAAARPGPRCHRRHAQVVGRRERQRLLQRRPTWRTRAGSRRSSSIPHYVFNFSDAFDDVRSSSPYVDAYAVGRDAESVRRMQSHDEVRARARAGAPARLRLRRDRAITRASSRPTTGPALRAGRRLRPRTSRTCSTCSAPTSSSRTLLPVGELTKADVRERARELGLRTADKRESMDVCFITRGGRRSVPRRADSAPCGNDRRRARRRSSARTTASTRSRSVSAAVWASRSANAGTSPTSRSARQP